MFSPRAYALTSVLAVTLVAATAGAHAAQDDTPEPCQEASTAASSPQASPAASPATTTTPAASPESAPSASPQASPATEACAVDMRDLAFSPANIEIASGTTVTWTNNDEVPHTATAGDGAFDSGILDPGSTFEYTFTESGTYDYACLIHPQMIGSVVVR